MKEKQRTNATSVSRNPVLVTADFQRVCVGFAGGGVMVIVEEGWWKRECFKSRVKPMWGVWSRGDF
jgi:hypothetical protein